MQTKTEEELTGFENESVEDILADYKSYRAHCNTWGYRAGDKEFLQKMSKELAKRGVYSYTLIK